MRSIQVFSSISRLLRNHLYLCLLIYCFLLHAPLLNAQGSQFFTRYLSENIRVEQGLSQNTVFCIHQDDQGFMWFGTWDGLNRFDGYSFISYNKEQGLSNESIRALYQFGNKLWIGTEDGLNMLDLDNNSIRVFRSVAGDSTTLSNNWINHITSDRNGKIWVSTAYGLNELDPATLRFRRVFSRDYGDVIRGNHFNMMLQDSVNNFWVATQHGLAFFEASTNKVTRYFHQKDDPRSLPDNQVNKITFGKGGQIWVGTRKGIASFNPSTGTFYIPEAMSTQETNINTPEILSLHYQHGGLLWAGTNGQGLIQLNTITGELSRNTNIANVRASLSDNRVFDIFTDNRGIMWVGTFYGLNKLNPKAPRFRTFRSNPNNPNSLINNSVWAFEEDSKGNIWIGTEGGISVLDREQMLYSHLKHQAGNSNSLSGNQIRTIRRDGAGNLWIGTRYHGLNRYHAASGKFTHYRHHSADSASIPDDFVLAVLPGNSSIWVGTFNGLGKLDPYSGCFRNYHHSQDDPNTLPDNRIYDIFQDSKGRIWICTTDGLALYNPLQDNFSRFRIQDTDAASDVIVSNKFFSVREGRNGLLWIGTRGGGLVSFDPESENFRVFTDKDGLPNNITYLAITDDSGDLWVSTNWGITRYLPHRNVFVGYEVTDGLQGNEFNFNAGILLRSGELLFGGMSGFNLFDPKHIQLNEIPPPVRITSFKRFNLIQNRRLKDGDTIRLRHDDNFFAFEFSALDFSNPFRVRYRYMLENYNSDWIDRDASFRIAEYAKMSPGTYRFKVIAANSDGFWNEEGASVVIIINPPWYQTWLFRIALLLLIVLLIYLLIRIRVKAIRTKHQTEKKYLEFQKKMFELEQKALQLQMNPHFIFNSLNSIQGFIVNNDIDNALHYLSKFSQLMRRTLANSRESSVSLSDELQALQLYVEIEKLRFSDKFEYTIQVDPEIDESFVEIPPMILQPYVENAIIHGLMHKKAGGKLWIELKQDNDNIIVIIEDNGVGRERATEIRRESGIERQSRGMMITGERLAILNQYTSETYSVDVIDLMDSNGQAAGTRVVINIYANLS